MHRARDYPTPEEDLAIPLRLWSHESLHHAQILISLTQERVVDVQRIGAIFLPHYSPERGWGHVQLSGPQRRELGSWMYGLTVTFFDFERRNPSHAHEMELALRSFIVLDAARRGWRRYAGDDPDSRRRRKSLVRRRVLALERLTAIFVEGLERREGTRLSGSDERTWVHFAVRGLEHPRLKVCEQCALVFAGRRHARRCTMCRRRPVRLSLHPVERGGWHVGFRVGERWGGGDLDTTVHYTAVCSGCSTPFATTRPQRRLCRNCGGDSGRVRRHRGSTSRTGRQSFRYRHGEGAADFSISTNTLAGRTVALSSVDGVIETDDAEVAWHLEALGTLQRTE